jgi:hypothetical protein
VNCNPHRHLKSPLSKPYHLLDKGKTTFPEKSKYDMDNPAVTKTMPTIFILITAAPFFVSRFADTKRHMPAMIRSIAKKRYIRFRLPISN